LLLGYLPGVCLGAGWLLFRADLGSGVHALSAAQGAADGIFVWPDSAVMNMRAAALVKMCVWSAPCLFLFAVLGRVRQRGNRYARLLAQSAVLTFVGYLFVRFDQGHGWGYRYFYSAWGTVPILAACAMGPRAAGGGPTDPRLISFAGAATLLSLLVLVPFQMHQVSGFIAEHLAQLAPPQRPGNNIYFVHPRGGFYAADMIQMDPLLRQPDLLLVSHGSKLDEQFIRDRWPDAVKMPSRPAADQWYLGPRDLRVPAPGTSREARFVLAPGGTPH
jgi:hypothetical protein